MSGNTVTSKYLLETSQAEIALDKMEAKYAKLEKKHEALIASSVKGANLYGNSWAAVKRRVDHYTQAVKEATNVRDWYAAIEKLQEASAQFKVIEGNLKGVISGESAAVVQVVRLEKSFNSLRDAIDRTKKARDAAIAGSSEFNVLTDKLRKLEEAYDRVATANKRAASPRGGGSFRKVDSDSEEGLRKQIGFLEKKRSAMGPGAEFDRLNGIIAKLQVRLKAVKEDAKKAGEALSEAATAPLGSFRKVEYELKKAKDELEMLTYGTKEYIQQSKKVDSIAAEYRKLDKDINKVVKAQKESGGLMGTITGQAKTLVMTYVGMHEVVSQITQEWEKQRQIQLDIAERGLGVEGALVQQAANIGVENIPAVKKWVRDNQGDLLGSQKDIVTLIGSAVSGGAADINDAMKVTAAAMKMNIGNVEMAGEMLQGGLTVARMNDSNDFAAAFGQLRSSSKASMAIDESEYIKNIMGKTFAMTRRGRNMDGLSSERALEYMTSASRIQADSTGDESSTNMAAVFQRTSDFAPQEKKKLKDGSVAVVSKEIIDAFKNSRSFDERLSLLRNNKPLGAQWEDRMRDGGPKRLAAALLMNDKTTQQIMKESADAVVSFADGAKVFRQSVVEVTAMVPNLVAAQVAGARAEQATSGDKDRLMATARARWDSIWNGGTDSNGNKVSPVNLSGWDTGVRMQLWDDRRAQRWARGVGRGDAAGNDVTDMINSLRPLIKFESEAGNKMAAGQLQAQLEALLIIAEEIKRLRQDVAVRPAAPPVNRAPALPRPAARAPGVN